MSLYNLVHGRQASAGLVLAILDKPESYFGRFRDAWVQGNDDGTCSLVIHTRNGGGNREHYNDEKEAGPECDCTGCVGTYRLPADPLYLYDEDDDYDCTYANFAFKVPEDAEAKVRALAKAQGVEVPGAWRLSDLAVVEPDMRAKWEAAIAAIKAAPPLSTAEPK